MENFIDSIEELNSIVKESFFKPQFIFKHSNRCSISSMALSRVLRDEQSFQQNGQLSFIDVIKERNISNEVEDIFAIKHESPQLLVIVDGKCKLSSSHSQINSIDAINILASNN